MKVSIRHRYVEKIPMLEVVSEAGINEALPLIIYYHGWQSAKELSLTQARKLAKKAWGDFTGCHASWGTQDRTNFNDSFCDFLVKHSI